MTTQPLALPGPLLIDGILHLLAVELRAEQRTDGWRVA